MQGGGGIFGWASKTTPGCQLAPDSAPAGQELATFAGRPTFLVIFRNLWTLPFGSETCQKVMISKLISLWPSNIAFEPCGPFMLNIANFVNLPGNVIWVLVWRLMIVGGCFWGLQLAFDRVHGVVNSTVGYIGGQDPEPTYESVCSGRTGHAEAVQVRKMYPVVIYTYFRSYWALSVLFLCLSHGLCLSDLVIFRTSYLSVLQASNLLRLHPSGSRCVLYCKAFPSIFIDILKSISINLRMPLSSKELDKSLICTVKVIDLGWQIVLKNWECKGYEVSQLSATIMSRDIRHVSYQTMTQSPNR